MPSANKTQRGLDLVAALLARRYGASFDELTEHVPGYRHDGTPKGIATAKRTFERDKDELRAFGVPLESQVAAGNEDDAEAHRYLLRSTDFYLPLISATLGGVSAPLRPSRGIGYAGLGVVALAFDELEALARAGDRARKIGDPVLAMEAEDALRKLAFDQPLAVTTDGTVHLADAHPKPARDVQTAVADALRRRKRLTFQYHSIERDTHAVRTVEPYGLVLQMGHWYLVARDTDANALRLFRLGRMHDAKVRAPQPNSADYEVPIDFDLAEHARSREAWELGDAEAVEVIVRFRAVTGAVRPALALGQPVRGRAGHRRFQVRRPDAFVRWLLSFAGAAAPVSPPAVVKAWTAVVAATAAHYADAGQP